MVATEDEFSNIKLINFGLSKSITDETTKSKALKFSLPWVSPEIINNYKKEPRSDIWSLGGTIIEMVNYNKSKAKIDKSFILKYY